MILLWMLLAAAEERPSPLLSVERVFVDRLTGGDTAAQMRDLLIASLEATKLFVITENQERADAILRGAAEDLVYTEVHATSDNVSARVQVGKGRGTRGDSRSYSGAAVGEGESSRIEDRRHEALATVRLVNKDGDVIWSTIQESRGGKFRGSSADVADKIAARLREDVESARKARPVKDPPRPRPPARPGSP